MGLHAGEKMLNNNGKCLLDFYFDNFPHWKPAIDIKKYITDVKVIWGAKLGSYNATIPSRQEVLRKAVPYNKIDLGQLQGPSNADLNKTVEWKRLNKTLKTFDFSGRKLRHYGEEKVNYSGGRIHMKRTYWRNGGSFYEQEIYIAPYNEGHQDETMLNNQKWKQSKMLQMRRKWKELFQRWSGKVERRHKITPQVIDYDGMEIIKVLRDEKMNPKDYIMLYFPFIKTDAKLNVLTAGLLFCPQWYRNYIHQF